ncbi:MAG: hypothetical protein WCW27_02790 [Patescibacteria group bacterium]|jgi:hypothetical protein
MNQTNSSQLKVLYGILALVVAVLVGLIGWFVYLLINPATPTDTTNTNLINQTNSATLNNSNLANTNLTNIANVNGNINTANTNTNSNANDNTNNSNKNTNTDTGLVEPDSNTNNNSNTNSNMKTVSLYFQPTGADCGEVAAVKRELTPNEADPYGQIMLEDMHGPKAEETGYSNAVPSSVKLKEVRYTSAGPLITVNEAYNSLSACQKQSVDAQLIKTANVMFDLPENGSGEVTVGEVDTNTNTNSN